MAFVSIFILSLIINALAPSFGGQKNSTQALKVAVYAFTPAWVAGALQILTPLAILGILLAFYGLYLLYLGLPVLMRARRRKRSATRWWSCCARSSSGSWSAWWWARSSASAR